MIFIYLFSLLFLILLINKFLLTKNLLISETGDRHQKFASSSKIPLTGGIFIFLGYLYFINDEILSFILFSFTILILGIFSDLKLIKSASIRFLLQISIVLIFVVFNDIKILDTRIFVLDSFLKNHIVNYFFISFCILVVINGSNFIDGMNTLGIGYYLLIGFIILYLNLNQTIIVNDISIIYFLIILVFVFILNLFNKLYLGDSGSYLLGFTFSIFLIGIYNLNQNISPFFIVLLLWYPCYENLFSIIRKNILNRSPMAPDQNHLHQLIFFFIKKNHKLKIFSTNILTAQIINFFNGCIFFIAINFIYSSQVQVLLILFNVILYTIIYFKLHFFKYKKHLKF
jgi:UDP-N-acetylmuramyl pentapeptide phosphotransferase/UDP-N-acetylglucosamine-1-phosphate transferase